MFVVSKMILYFDLCDFYCKSLHTFLLLANCSNWCRNDVIGGWYADDKYCGLFVSDWCCACGVIEEFGNVVINGISCGWLGTGTEYIWGDKGRLSVDSLKLRNIFDCKMICSI